MMPTIDCRSPSARDPSNARLRGAAKLAGVGLAAFCTLILIAVVLEPQPATAPSPPTTPIHAATAQVASDGQTAAPDIAPSSSAGDVRPDNGIDYLSLKAEAEEKLLGLLSDDHGVRYRDVHTELSTLDGGGIVAFCGEENNRTPLGGYAGFQRFVASRSVAVTEAQMSDAEFAQAWSQFCENAVEGPQVWF